MGKKPLRWVPISYANRLLLCATYIHALVINRPNEYYVLKMLRNTVVETRVETNTCVFWFTDRVEESYAQRDLSSLVTPRHRG